MKKPQTHCSKYVVDNMGRRSVYLADEMDKYIAELRRSDQVRALKVEEGLCKMIDELKSELKAAKTRVAQAEDQVDYWRTAERDKRDKLAELDDMMNSPVELARALRRALKAGWGDVDVRIQIKPRW
ncbi:hypothetical protein [Brevibacterium moorei]|uniref:hypothetical protein n=1 Tax=Brevibacterium moorei TaxID=2968457 RepID=UPI00211CF355|nr:hypothetical protein [Brevibacterium sp. 68QC2CO]MCQ9385144.1 hypothetical protein [Brevibacterium sp. 68QC2CO]